MQTNTMTSKKSSGCGCSGGGGRCIEEWLVWLWRWQELQLWRRQELRLRWQGCSVCEAPPRRTHVRNSSAASCLPRTTCSR